MQDATFHVTQLRGFEKFCEGRPFYEMPNITARICGICPVSHLVASSKACDAILAVKIPPVAAHLRQIMNLAQLIQSHALSFFYLSSPDLLLGMDAPAEERNILHVAHTHPSIGADGVALRQFGQRIIELLAGRRIHPGWTVPGGVNEPLSAEKRDQILGMIPAARAAIQRTLGWFKGAIEKFSRGDRSVREFSDAVHGAGRRARAGGVLRRIVADYRLGRERHRRRAESGALRGISSAKRLSRTRT